MKDEYELIGMIGDLLEAALRKGFTLEEIEDQVKDVAHCFREEGATSWENIRPKKESEPEDPALHF
jgi:hypothetical protein